MKTDNPRRKMLATTIGAGVALSTAFSTQLAGAAQLEEIMVTARKTSESMQDAPLAVSAATREKIEAASMGDARAIAQFAPNIVFDEIPTGTVGGGGISIRGISYQDVEKSFDPTVIIYTDGVPGGHATGNVMSLLDVERIEVLRGPQGTLFGKNAVGGVINIHRIKPKLGEWAGKARLRVEDGDAPTVEGVLNIPLGENLAAKVTGAYVETPGYFESTTPGLDDFGYSEEDRFGVHFLWEPTENLTAEFQYNVMDMEGIQTPTLNTSGPMVAFCAVFGACAKDGAGFTGDPTKTGADFENDFTYETESYQFNLDWAVNDSLNAIVIAAHKEDEEYARLDLDDFPGNLYSAENESEYEQDSLELRLDYVGERLKVTGGYFYWESEMPFWSRNVIANGLFGLVEDFGQLREEDIFGPPPADNSYCTSAVPCSIGTASYAVDSDSYFFEGEYALTDSLFLIAGARYIDESKEIAKQDIAPIFGNAVNLPFSTGSRNDSDTIYRFGARYESSLDTMFYATYSTGFRSGGFSIRAATPEVLGEGYDPETLHNYEVGMKTTLFDNRLRLNLAAFHMEYEDMQVELQISRPGGGTQSAVVNAAEATYDGLELEATAVLTDAITMDFNVGVLDASYDKFVGKVYEDDTLTTDNSSLDLRRAPDLNYTLALNYNTPVGDGDLFGRVSYFWTDEYEGAVGNFDGSTIDAHGMLDASMNYRTGNWVLGVYGRNLTDEDAWSHNFGVAMTRDGAGLWTFASPRKPRHFGAEVTYTFGDY